MEKPKFCYSEGFDSLCCDLMEAYSKVQERAAVKVGSTSFLTSQCTACQEASSIPTGRVKPALHPRTPHLAASHVF